MRYSEILAALLGLIIRDRVATGCTDNGDKTKDPRCKSKSATDMPANG